ncbi:MAG: type I DNA topoisomerase [Ignavibacteriaceae bacterium]|jgi:DNA topoisomerase-1
MSKNLVLVESPAKAKTINKYLGRNYHVEATVGHIKNLPKSKLGIDVDNAFQPQFVTIRGKGDLLKKIKSLSAKSDNIYIATDPDREGEAIAQDIADFINIKEGTKVFRVLFNEITKNGVLRGMQAPRAIDSTLVASQRARRIMDRLIGYKVSPFLWKAVIQESGITLSAGRVQSVALRLICEREIEIEKFKAIEYWSIWGFFETASKEIFKAKLFSVAGKEIKVAPHANMTDVEREEFLKNHILLNNEADTLKIYNDVKQKKNFEISRIVKKHTKRNPSPPFITSSLQSEASKALRFRAKQTMGIAQKLYEGIDLGKDGTVGLITYMRTDSTRISEEILVDTREFIKQNFGENYLPAAANQYDKKKNANVQDAHEAIRPTSMAYTPEKVKEFLDDKSFKLYQLIWKRFIASQMKQAELETTVIEISADEFLFKAYGQALLFNGFMRMYVEVNEQTYDPETDDKAEAKNETIPAGLEKDDKLLLNDLKETQHFTKAPPRYTESSLIKELESKGIGRPSTYSSIVSTVVDRSYVAVTERKLAPTHLGVKVNGILVENFPNIFDVSFTARMESELDQIAQGENEFVSVLNDFYKPFSETLAIVEDKIEKILCDKCGNEMAIRFSRFGKYLACTNYPDCKNIKSFKDYSQDSKEPEYTGETCPKCNNRTIYRNGKFGRFIGCEKYPDCDYIKNISLGIACPKCKDGEVVERRSKRNKAFYGCSKYPDCDYVSWNKPIAKPCPNGDSTYLEHKYSAKKGNYLKCPVCGEEMIEELEEQSEDTE